MEGLQDLVRHYESPWSFLPNPGSEQPPSFSARRLRSFGLRSLLHACTWTDLWGLGATALTFLASPENKTRTLLVGIVTGLVSPLAFFGALIEFLGPKNEGVAGWIIYGSIFALTGAVASFEAGNAVLSEKFVR